MVGDLGDVSKVEINAQYERRIKKNVRLGNWGVVKDIAGRMKKNSERMGTEYVSESERVYKCAKGEVDPYQTRNENVLYSLAFVSFALGGMLLFGNFTGNVVGEVWGGEVNIVGAVLVSLGAVGALILSRRM